MAGKSNKNVFLIPIDALSFAEFEISDFEISRFDCIMYRSKPKTGLTVPRSFLLLYSLIAVATSVMALMADSVAALSG